MTDTHSAAPSSPRTDWAGPCTYSSVHDLPFPAKAAGVAAAFWIFPPLGVGALAWLAVAGRRRARWAAAHWEQPGEAGAEQARDHWREGRSGRRCGRGMRRGFYRGTGNSAFDEAQRAEVERLREEARKLHEEAQAFRDFERREKEKRDREAFEKFAAERNKPQDGAAPPA
jgi:hypothetical protein